MEIPLGILEKIKISQHLTDPTSKQLDKAELYLILTPAATAISTWKQFHHGALLHQRQRQNKVRPEETSLFTTHLPNAKGTQAVIGYLASDSTSFSLLTLARKLVQANTNHVTRNIVVHMVGLDDELARQAGQAALSAVLAKAALLPRFQQKKSSQTLLSTISLCGLPKKIDAKRTVAELTGNHLARWLTSLPGNKLTPRIYKTCVSRLAREQGWTMRFLDSKTLARKKAGAFLAVTQGSPNTDAGIVHLSYKPRKTNKGAKRLALVGKGICFDTGGVNVKSARYMNGMQGDMQGSAVALGTFLALTKLQVNFPIDCWLAIAENHIGPKAYKPGDVVRAINGTQIEVIHTDAEGRMVLADTLSLAGQKKPALIIDYATLTGTCVSALSTRYSGAFTNRDELIPTLINAGKDSGERVWPFPLDDDYDDALQSRVADIKQCTLDGEADHILAARFLQRFVPKESAWIHVDLSAGEHKGGLAHIPGDITGFGVRFTLDLLLNQKAL